MSLMITVLTDSSSHMVSGKAFLDRSRPVSCKHTQIGCCQIASLWMWITVDQEPC